MAYLALPLRHHLAHGHGILCLNHLTTIHPSAYIFSVIYLTLYTDNPILPLRDTRTSRCRPERQSGLSISNTLHPTPDPIRKKFAEGWVTHVPLDYLTDNYCANPNRRPQATAALRDGLGYDAASGELFTTSSSLDSSTEYQLSFDEWYQAWGRLLSLIEEFLP